MPDDPDVNVIKSAIHEVKALLAYARVPLTHEFTTEYSHHYGVANFREVGAVLINVINRAYAKKVLVQLPGQMHPLHFHKLKEETFLVLWGELISELDGRERVLRAGRYAARFRPASGTASGPTPAACSRKSRRRLFRTIRSIGTQRSTR